MATICPYCNIEVSESSIEAEDGCCPECGSVISATSSFLGENDEFVREAVCEGLEPFGIKVDKKENHTRKPGARVISTPDSRIPVLIIPTNEELEIATTTMRIVEESQK